MQISLHRASRILDAIERYRRAMDVTGRLKVSVFSTDPNFDVQQARSKVGTDTKVLKRLLQIRSTIRGLVALSNAKSGISSLLAVKSGIEDEIAALETLPGVARRVVEEEKVDIYGRTRKSRNVPLRPLDVTTLLSQVNATAARYAAGSAAVAGEGVAVEVETSLLAEEDIATYRTEVAALKRNLDHIVEQLRSLNANPSLGFELSDEDIQWLEDHQVI